MIDNVIIFGAGASVDAGVPLLGNFVDKMLEYGLKGKVGNKAISDEDKKIFDEAMKVRNELDGYHGRASFNDRNIEDILSILAFNLMVGDKADRAKLDWMTKAIARTVDLSTNIRFDPRLHGQIQRGKTQIYTSFWNR
ncbi:MAG: hypothetical protein WCC12_08550, partial [Anaerolineales bacterium]